MRTGLRIGRQPAAKNSHVTDRGPPARAARGDGLDGEKAGWIADSRMQRSRTAARLALTTARGLDSKSARRIKPLGLIAAVGFCCSYGAIAGVAHGVGLNPLHGRSALVAERGWAISGTGLTPFECESKVSRYGCGPSVLA